MNIYHYCFVCPVTFSNEKKSFRYFFEKKWISNILDLFANTSHLTNIIPIPIRKLWNSRTTFIPIRTEVGTPNLFLFLFAGKITIR